MPPPADRDPVSEPHSEGAARRLAERRARRRAAARRRLLALAAIALIALGAGAYAGSRAHQDGEPGPGAEDSARAPSCPRQIAGSPRRLVGQMMIVRMEATATDGLRRLVRRGEIGGVILFPPEGTPPGRLRGQVEALRAAATAGQAATPLVAIDQEGGPVKRLPQLPPALGPVELADEADRVARRQGRATGTALARLGIDVNLAPVLDLPAGPEAFIAARAFGSDPEAVAGLTSAFGLGLQGGGVAATAKHFPGLGLAAVNTDSAPSAIDATRAQLAAGLEPFERAITAGFELVMVSNATYPAYDAERPASQSRRLVEGLLRDGLGFRGPVISDDLGAGALVGAGIDEGEAAVGAARAGVDLLLFALSNGEVARAAMLRALRRGQLGRRALVRSCARTNALRERLATTGPGT